MDIQRVDHIAVAVWSIQEALVLYDEVFGGVFLLGGDDDTAGMRNVPLTYPAGMNIELLQPTRSDSYVHQYLEKRGPGFHHTTIVVHDAKPELG